MLFLVVASWLGGQPTTAAPPQEWEVMGIYFPADQQREVVPRFYMPIELEDLEFRLAQESERRKAALLNAPGLAEAIYVARLEGEQLASDFSLWKFSGNPTPQSFTLGKVSVALRDARGVSDELEQLSDYLRFDATGAIELTYTEGDAQRWFSFLATAEAGSDGKLFKLQFPPATIGKMLISTPKNYELSSTDVAIEPIGNPATYLPGDWPTSVEAARPFAQAVRWWLVNLSGQSEFSLAVNSVQNDGSLWYKHTLRSVETEYVVGEQLMEVNSNIELASSSAEYPLRIRMSQGMRIKTLLVDGVPARWRSITSLSGESRLIEIVDAEFRSGTRIDVAAIHAAREDERESLPDMAVAEAYAISGTTRVWASEGKTTDNVEAAGIEFTVHPRITETGEVLGYDDMYWSGNWIGSAPPIAASFSRREARWHASSMTRINIQSASLSANTRLQISANRLDSNEIRLQVGKDWFIDDINLISDSEGDIHTQFVEFGNDNQRKTEIVISWERSRRNLALDLEIAAHRPREQDAESINLRMPKLVSLREADQQDIYVVESLGRYRVQLTHDLLPIQRQPREIPSWQQTLLPQLTDVWIFEGTGATIPNITLRASGGTFSSKTNALLSVVEGGFKVDYQIACQPISGSLDRLKLIFPADFKPENATFEFTDTGSENGVPVELMESRAAEDSDALEVEIQLPKAASAPFEIRASYPQSTSEGAGGNSVTEYPVYLPGMPGALTAECTLVLPKAMAHFRGQPTLELLPASACCSAEQLRRLTESTPQQTASALVAVRVEASESHQLRLNSTRSPNQRGWIWEEFVEHRVWDDGSQHHRVIWDVEVGQLSQAKLKLPQGWQLERVLLDDVELNGMSGAQETEVEFGLPMNRRTQVAVECSSIMDADDWFRHFLTHIEVERPTIGIPVLVSKQIVLIPPRKVAVDSLALPRSSRLLDRLFPHSWWTLLAPNAFGSRQPQASLGWSLVEMEPGQAGPQAPAGSTSLWMVERSAISALLLASMMALGAFFWLVLGKWSGRWWLVISLLVVVTILVPVAWLPVAQLMLMAICLAAFARMVSVITRRTDKKRASEIRTRSKLASDVRLTLLLPLAATVFLLNSSVAQESPASFRAAQANQAEDDSASEDGSAETPNIYGILLPIDEDGEISGFYAHIPTQLWQLLSAPDRDSASAGPPKILSAEYSLATRPGSVGEQDSIQEFSVEFRVQVLQANSELRLPFDASELQLVDARVKDREVLIGLSTIKQEERAVVFRSPEVGTMPIKLRFLVNTPADAPESPQLSAMIPSVPNARLRINFTGNPKFKTNAIGGTERTATGELLSYLGPIDRLSVWWSDNVRRPTAGNTVDIGSETWIHANGPHVMAACQLRIGPQQSLPTTLNVNVDSDWEPVGTDWGDAEIISSEPSNFRKRVVYKLQLTDKSVAGPRVVRVLLVPRTIDAATSLSLPFLSLQEVPEQSLKRVLAWSRVEGATWKPDGVDFWPELASSAADWGELSLAPVKRLYRVAPGTGALQLRRQPGASQSILNETTVVRVDDRNSEIQYLATWENDDAPTSILRLQIPRDAKVSSVLLDDEPATFRVSIRENVALLLVSNSEERTDPIGRMEIKLALPIPMEKPTHLPRIVLEDVSVRRSVYRLFRAASVHCQLASSGKSDLQLAPVALSSTKLLDGLEVLIGEVDLGESYREDATIPILATVSQQPQPKSKSLIMTLDRGADGWTASVFAEWDADAKIDFAYFDLPISVRDNIDSGTFIRKFLPTADSSRTTLCMIPAVTTTGQKQLTFSFPLLSGVSGQSLAIPQIRLLAKDITLPILALPRNIDEQAVRWKKAGRRMGREWHERMGVEDSGKFEFFQPDERQTQLNWQPIETGKQNARVEQQVLRILRSSSTHVSGFIEYWVVPRGQLAMQFKIPEGCQVLGVEGGGGVANWERKPGQLLQVTMQPNYLPINLRVLARWELQPETALQELEIPQALVEGAASDLLVFLEDSVPWNLDAQSLSKATEDSVDVGLAERWMALLSSTLHSQQGLSATEIEIWLSMWSPDRVGIRPLAMVDPKLLATFGSEFSGDDGFPVSEFWARLTSKFGGESALAIPSENRFRSSTVRLTPVVRLTPRGVTENFVPRAVAAGFVSLVGLLGFVLGMRLRASYLNMLSAQPWIYWLQLAGVAWILLPLAWPGYVIAGISVAMLVGQLFDFRQKPRPLTRA